MAEKKSRDKHFHAASGQHLELKRVFKEVPLKQGYIENQPPLKIISTNLVFPITFSIFFALDPHPHRHSWAQSITWKNTHTAESQENEQFGQYKGSFILQYKIPSSVHQAILCIVQRPLLFNYF